MKHIGLTEHEISNINDPIASKLLGLTQVAEYWVRSDWETNKTANELAQLLSTEHHELIQKHLEERRATISVGALAHLKPLELIRWVDRKLKKQRLEN